MNVLAFLRLSREIVIKWNPIRQILPKDVPGKIWHRADYAVAMLIVCLTSSGEYRKSCSVPKPTIFIANGG